MTRIKKDEIDKWINSPEGQKKLQEAFDKIEEHIKESHKGGEWTFEEWIRLLFTPYTDKDTDCANKRSCL